MTDEPRSTASDEWYHKQLEAVLATLTRIDVSLSTSNVTITSLVAQGIDHETRIRTVEKWQSSLTPYLAAMTFICGIVTSFLLERLL